MTQNNYLIKQIINLKFTFERTFLKIKNLRYKNFIRNLNKLLIINKYNNNKNQYKNNKIINNSIINYYIKNY
jgi:hypothetical protein